MISTLLRKIFGSRNDRLLKRYMQTVRAINSLEPEIEKLSDEDLRAKTEHFKQRFAKGETLDQLLPEAFAVVREAGKRALNMRHFDMQLVGGMVLHYGKIAEMRTGEGKTLVATLPAYLNALAGQGVHVVTVNDYLASRDAAWMGKLYGFLGLSVGVNLSQMDHASKQVAYAADITYDSDLDELGDLYVKLDRVPFAVRSYEEALMIREEVTAKHNLLPDSYLKLALAYDQHYPDKTKAEEYYKLVIDATDKAGANYLGDDGLRQR